MLIRNYGKAKIHKSLLPVWVWRLYLVLKQELRPVRNMIPDDAELFGEATQLLVGMFSVRYNVDIDSVYTDFTTRDGDEVETLSGNIIRVMEDNKPILTIFTDYLYDGDGDVEVSDEDAVLWATTYYTPDGISVKPPTGEDYGDNIFVVSFCDTAEEVGHITLILSAVTTAIQQLCRGVNMVYPVAIDTVTDTIPPTITKWIDNAVLWDDNDDEVGEVGDDVAPS